jgi:Xaa-Pro aminopeptidase
MTEVLAQIRQLMKERNWDLYILPRTDEHQSEYIAPCD